MRVTKSHIVIGSIEFDFMHQVECERNWESLTNTCSIMMPANVKLDKNKLRDLVKPGDAVLVEVGYDGELKRVFTGYVAGITPKVPIEFRCEDEMYLLKSTSINDHIKNCSVQTLLQKHFIGIKTDAIDADLGDFRIENLSQAKVLDKVKEMGLFSFFRDGVLVIGKPYDPSYANTVKFHLSGNKRNIIEESLEYRRANDVKLQVTAISIDPAGKRTEQKVGDQGGETRTLNYYNLSSAELLKAAQRDYSRLIYDGYRGSFTAFLEPFTRQGDIVELISPEENNQSGSFWVDKVKYIAGTEGYRQEITLGPRS